MRSGLAPALRRLLEAPEPTRRLGPYRLIRQLGRGGFAPVWLAEEVYGTTKLRAAAVKLFAVGALHDRDDDAGASASVRARHRQRVIEEARALCQVEHPNIARFHGLAIDESRDVVGLAMEYVAGVSLDRRIDGRDKLPLEDTLDAGVAVASALTAVHRSGLVHRDVKPANVVQAAGVHKLIDFGIAAAVAAPPVDLPDDPPGATQRIVLDHLPIEVVGTSMSQVIEASAGEGRTRSTAILTGTVGYIDPACVRGEPATAASDLYGLGALLFECLTGKLPAAAAAGKDGGLRGDVLDGRASPPSLRDVEPAAPPALASLVDALLHPDRGQRPRSAELVAIELERARAELGGRQRKLPPESVGPFRGLGRYEASDRDVFFGRSAEVAAALELCRSRGLVALVGPSGSGKSSLARAGLLPAIAGGALGGRPERWDVAVASPGVDPRAAIARELEPWVPGAAEMEPDAVVGAILERAASIDRGLLLLVDQLEELVTVAGAESRSWAAGLLVRLAERTVPGVRVIVAIRRDLLDPLLALGDLGRAVVRGTLLVSPMNEAAWGDVLEASLAAYGYGFEDDALRGEVQGGLRGSDSAMPLIQFALAALWERRDTEAKRITRAALVGLGGIAGALERHADATFDATADVGPSGRAIAREMLLALTTPQGTRATKSERELLAGSVERSPRRRVLSRLEEARLVVRDAGGLTLAHDALLGRWSRLRYWLAEAREDRLLAEEVEASARKWAAEGRDETLLLRKRRLAAASDLLRRGDQPLSPDATAFVAAGRRAERASRALLGVAAAIALAAAAGGALLYVIRIDAERANTERQFEQSQRHLALAEKKSEEAARNRDEANANADAARAAQAEATRLKERFHDDLVSLLDRVREARSAKELAAIQREVAQRPETAATAKAIPSGIDPSGFQLLHTVKAPTSPDAGEPTSAAEADVGAVVKEMHAAFKACYRQGLKGAPDMQGSVRITATIARSGKVTSVTPSGGEGLSAPVIDCLTARVAGAQFPPQDGDSTIVIPVTFVPQ